MSATATKGAAGGIVPGTYGERIPPKEGFEERFMNVLIRRHAPAGAIVIALFGFALTAPAPAGQPHPAQTRTTAGGRVELPSDEIIRRFAAAESELRIARNNYTFTQDVTIQQMAAPSSDIVTGTFRRVSEIIFDDQSKRIEKITFFPSSTLTQFSVTPADLNDLGVIQPFALTIEDLPKYNVIPKGRERIDEIDTYVFDVVPKDPAGMAKRGERYLTGRVWVEDEGYMIVKVAGQAGPESKEHQYPRFETYRENIDGKYWFPTYTYANDVLEFERQDVRMRMVVKYTDYKKFSGTITIEPDEPEQ
jgi:hypothetical protein